MNAYEILGVSPNATEEEVKAAYKELSRRYYSDSSTESPLKEQNEEKMRQINAAFDEIITELRGGMSRKDNYADIRTLIKDGNADSALSRLRDMGERADDAEWNFLMGSAYYYKGWVTQAQPYFENACNLKPDNAEYSSAYTAVKNSMSGNMYGSPYPGTVPDGSAMGACGPCDLCGTLLCANLCCNCGRGGC